MVTRVLAPPDGSLTRDTYQHASFELARAGIGEFAEMIAG